MWLDNASDIDILFYGPYARLIAEIAEEEGNNPLTIGVFGLWGAGKSTLLNLIEQEIKDENGKPPKDIVTVKINAWMFEGYEDAKTALMEALLKDLYHAKPFEDVKGWFKKLFKRIDKFKLATSAISMGASVAASIATGDPSPIALSVPRNVADVAGVIKSASEKASEFKEEYTGDAETTVDNIRNFKEDFEEILLKAKVKNVVVIIDDLDRCTPERIIDTLEAIKLFLSVDRTTFIIAADEKVIEYAIKKKYPNIDGSNVELSAEYIEKIIQLPIYIPDLSSKDIENYLLLLVAQKHILADNFKKLINKIYKKNLIVKDERISLADVKSLITELGLPYVSSEAEFTETASIIDDIRDIVSTTLKGNPRQAKRFLNTFITKKSLAQMYYGSEINMRILAKLLVLQKLDPSLFIQLNEWNKRFTVCNDEFKTMYDAVVANTNNADYSKWALPTIKKWLDCEPKDIYAQRLDKYFYLTRENLPKNIIEPQNFTSEARTLLEQIGSATLGSINGIIERMKKLPSTDHADIFSVLLPRVESGQLGYFVTKFLYIGFVPYQDKIAEAVGKSKNNITPADSVELKAMYKADSDKINLALLKLKANGKLSQNTYDMIIKEE